MESSRPSRSHLFDASQTLSRYLEAGPTKGRLTSHALKVGLVLSLGALSPAIPALVVAPDGKVLQTSVELAILEVLGGGDTGSACSVHQILELDCARATILARPLRRNRTTGVGDLFAYGKLTLKVLEIDRVDLYAVECPGTALTCVIEHELVRLGSNHIPRIALRAVHRDKVGVCAKVSIQGSVSRNRFFMAYILHAWQ